MSEVRAKRSIFIIVLLIVLLTDLAGQPVLGQIPQALHAASQAPYLVRDIVGQNTESAHPIYLTEVKNNVVFKAFDAADDAGLWVSDGSPTGTTLLYADARDVYGLTNVNDTLFFVKFVSDGFELWKSDITPMSTSIIKHLQFTNWDTGAFSLRLANVSGNLLFLVERLGYGIELWISDGTDSGTVLVNSITSNCSVACASQSVIVLNDILCGRCTIQIWTKTSIYLS